MVDARRIVYYVSAVLIIMMANICSLGKERGLSVTQVFPEGGNLGLVLPSDLCKWTTDKVRKVGVAVHPGTLISKAGVEEGKVKVTLSNGEEVSIYEYCI